MSETRDIVERAEKAEARVAELEKLVYVPGHWRCPKCRFYLVSTILDVTNDRVAANTKPQQCGNGCGPMWRVTEREAGDEMVKRAEEYLERAVKAESSLASCEAAARPLSEWHEDIGDVLWWQFPIEEPPYVGSPLDTNWPGYHTHWTPIAIPRALTSQEPQS